MLPLPERRLPPNGWRPTIALAVHVEIADRRAPLDVLDRRRAAREQPPRESERQLVHAIAGGLHTQHRLHREQRAEDLLVQHLRVLR